MLRISGEQRSLLTSLFKSLCFRTGVRLGLSTLIEARNVNAGGHKLGLSLDFESWAIETDNFTSNYAINILGF